MSNLFTPPSWHTACIAAGVGYWNTKEVAKIARHWTPEQWASFEAEEKTNAANNSLIQNSLLKKLAEAKKVLTELLSSVNAKNYIKKLGLYDSIAYNRVNYGSLSEVRREVDALLNAEKTAAYHAKHEEWRKNFTNEAVAFLFNTGKKLGLDFTLESAFDDVCSILRSSANKHVNSGLVADTSHYTPLLLEYFNRWIDDEMAARYAEDEGDEN